MLGRTAPLLLPRDDTELAQTPIDYPTMTGRALEFGAKSKPSSAHTVVGLPVGDPAWLKCLAGFLLQPIYHSLISCHIAPVVETTRCTGLQPGLPQRLQSAPLLGVRTFRFPKAPSVCGVTRDYAGRVGGRTTRPPSTFNPIGRHRGVMNHALVFTAQQGPNLNPPAAT